MTWSRRSVLSGGSAAILAGAVPRRAWAKTEADVIIVGAGLSGLLAARTLEAAGLKCLVLEGERRIGGRLHTLDDLPGKPEAGGIQIGSGYKRLHALAKATGIALREGAAYGVGAADSQSGLFHINGTTVNADDWKTSPANRLSETERGTLPNALAFLAGGKMPRLDSPNAWMQADPSLDISVDAALRQAGLSAEARRLVEANFNGNTLASMSQVNLMRTAAIFRAGPGPVFTVSGGSQRLPEAMAGTLKSPVRLGQIVSAIEEDETGVRVVANGRSLHTRHAICTIPFAVLRSIHLAGNFGVDMATMIASLNYTRASFAFVEAREPFWKADGFPETLWTDDPWLGRVFAVSESPPLLKVWTRGAGADLLDRATPDQARAEIVRRIENARPSAQGKLGQVHLFSWQKNPMARGIYHHIGTGQSATLASATQEKGKRLHFAGEHLAQASSGMEGALESGERAALALLAAA
ncbi:flavin monoamine oxidase family protein [Sphingorhabdus contaminans]|uniref:flavin monoamine oxidase family protein n=1 Tax=Sphingorhabdus contaminans TaxID=1343899 RepID=UPI003D271DBA